MPRSVRTYSRNSKLVQERRTHIINHALRLFLAKGYDRTTMRELAESCAMTEGSLYRYIGSKDDILHLLLLDTKISIMTDFQKSLGNISVVDALQECVKIYYKWCNDAADKNMFYNREIINFSEADRRVLLKSQSDYIHFFEDLIKKGIKEGVFKATNPLLLAHNIVMQGFDWGLRRWFLRSYFTLDDYIKLQLELIFDQLHIFSETQENYLAPARSIT